MLKLLLGTDWIKNRDAVFKMISDDVANMQEKRILMVPELISHDAERRLCQWAGDTASRYAEVLSFTRLARRVADLVGHSAVECLDNGGRIVAMAAAARMLHSKLKSYAAVETRPEFLSDLIEAIDEFKRCCVTPEDLKKASGNTGGALAQKLEELGLLYEAYEALCQRGKMDPRDQMTWLLEQLEDCSFAKDRIFYIEGFPDFTRQHMSIIEHLIRESPLVVVSLNCDRPNATSLAFEKPGDTAAELIQCAKRASVEVQIQYVEPRNDHLSVVRDTLFHGNTDGAELRDDVLRVYQTESVYQECISAAEQIIRLVQNGARYRDIGIVFSDPSAYQRTLSAVFRRCGIPLYLSGTEEVLQKNIISSIIAAVDAALSGFEQRDVLRYMKSVLSPVDLKTSDEVDNYALLWNIRGSRWTQEWTNHPFGLGAQMNDAAIKRLEHLNAARRSVVLPLIHLKDRFDSAVKLSEQVSALYGFLEEINLADRLARLADRFDRDGDNRNAQILNQIWEILISALEQLHDVLGETTWDTDAFVRLFRLLLAQYDVGTIPPVLDSVSAGRVSAMRCHQVKHLFVLGVLEGSMPGYGSMSGVLTEPERTALRAIGVPLSSGSAEKLQTEFTEIYGVFCSAELSVTVSCPSGQPSFIYRRLLRLAGSEATPAFSCGAALTNPVAAGAYLIRNNMGDCAPMLNVLNEYEAVNKQISHGLGEVSSENIARLYGNKLNLSASQIDKQADCRLAYFLKYGLFAQERKPAEIDPAEFGTYVHAVLEDTIKEVMARGGFREISLEKTLEIANAYSNAYAQEHFADLESIRMTYLLNRNAAELEMIVCELWRELHDSLFLPIGFEVAFGEGKQMAAIPVSGKNMDAQLLGFVDRVDLWESDEKSFFRVVDYKTGKKDFDYCDVFNGRGLQMLLYMFALEQEGKSLLNESAVPAGVQYFPARAPLISIDGVLTPEEIEMQRDKMWKRKGLVLSDDEVLRAMEPESAKQRISYKRTKDGAITGDVADRTQFAALKQYVFDLVSKMVDEIASGCIAPNPYTRGTSHNACTFCPYGAVCHSESVEGRRDYKAMSAQEFWEEVYKELKSNG